MYFFKCAEVDTRVRRQHSVTNASENCKLQWAKWKVNHVLTLRSCFWIKLMFVTWSNKSSFSHCRLFQCSFREGHGKKLAVETRHSNIQGKKNNNNIIVSVCVFLKRFLITVLPAHGLGDCSLFHHVAALELS